MAVKFHEKNQAFFIGLQPNGQSSGVGTQNGSVSLAVASMGTGGLVTLSNSAPLYVGAEIVVAGTNSGTGTGITAGTYYVIATNNSTTMNLSATRGGVAITTTAGTFATATITLAILDASSALAITSLTADPTRTTTANTYLGDSLSRDEFTVVTDTYVNVAAETFQQILVDTVTAINPDTNSIWKTLQLCGANISVNATTKAVSAGNNIESPDYGTADRRLSSPDDATYDKLYKYTDLRGSVDVDASVTAVPKLKFTLNGNAWPPVKAPKQTANFATQAIRVAPVVLPTTIKTAQLALLDDVFTNALGTVSNTSYTSDGRVILTTGSHGLTVGNIVAIQVTLASLAILNGTFVARVTSATTVEYFVKGLTTTGTATSTVAKKGDTAVQTFCFSTMTAPNFFGFDYQRYTTGCDTGFSKNAVPTDITVGMLEDQQGGTGFDPSYYMSKFFGVYIQFGNANGGAGTKVGYLWDKVQLANDKEGKVGSYLGRDASFRNTGNSFMLWE